jgi:hypothetical protein
MGGDNFSTSTTIKGTEGGVNDFSQGMGVQNGSRLLNPLGFAAGQLAVFQGASEVPISVSYGPSEQGGKTANWPRPGQAQEPFTTDFFVDCGATLVECICPWNVPV